MVTHFGGCDDGAVKSVRIEVFGGLRMSVDRRPVVVSGRVRRRLLALLVARRGTTCRAEWLSDLLWDGDPAEARRATLQSHIAHLRRVLEPDRRAGEPWPALRTVSGGYLLAVEHVEVDADDLIAALHLARGHPDDGVALGLAAGALALVAGPAYDGDRDLEEVLNDATRLDLLAEEAAELRLGLLARLGRHDEVIEHARPLVVAHPTRELARRLLADALGAVGRRAEALRELHTYRTALGEETGLEPSQEIATLERELLDAGRNSALGSGLPPTPLRYADRDGVHICYQVVGEGPAVVAVPPFAQNIELCWQDHHHRRLLERAAQRVTFVHFDKRGTGTSDRAANLDFDERLQDFEAVLDDAGIERAVLCGVSEAGPLAVAFANRHPERVAGLYLVNTFARTLVAPDYPIGIPGELFAAVTSSWERAWGRDPRTIAQSFAPSLVDDEAYLAWLGHYMRQSCSPGTLSRINAANAEIDVRPLLATITAPTVVTHRIGDRVAPIAWGRYLADHIPNATFVESPGADHLPWIGDDWPDIVDRLAELAERCG
ncbi:MAG: alpha/beta fold hydrolase [Acidimicrobiales bacterium]|nr:alpha/beta fold hydrolase [Acidimicrobiales bacterium]